jgi:hypothetical protein
MVKERSTVKESRVAAYSEDDDSGVEEPRRSKAPNQNQKLTESISSTRPKPVIRYRGPSQSRAVIASEEEKEEEEVMEKPGAAIKHMDHVESFTEEEQAYLQRLMATEPEFGSGGLEEVEEDVEDDEALEHMLDIYVHDGDHDEEEEERRSYV